MYLYFSALHCFQKGHFNCKNQFERLVGGMGWGRFHRPHWCLWCNQHHFGRRIHHRRYQSRHDLNRIDIHYTVIYFELSFSKIKRYKQMVKIPCSSWVSGAMDAIVAIITMAKMIMDLKENILMQLGKCWWICKKQRLNVAFGFETVFILHLWWFSNCVSIFSLQNSKKKCNFAYLHQTYLHRGSK